MKTEQTRKNNMSIMQQVTGIYIFIVSSVRGYQSHEQTSTKVNSNKPIYNALILLFDTSIPKTTN